MTDQAAFVFKTILALGPLAIYFLGLGLVNSQARPCILSARADFTILATVFVPLIAAPIILLLEHDQAGLVSVAIVGVAALFFTLLPRPGSGWVVYNCSPAQGRRLLYQAYRRLGWRVESAEHDRHRIPGAGLNVSLSALPLLRSVTLSVERSDRRASSDKVNDLVAAFRDELAEEAMLPSATGISLVVIGAALLGVPMWYLFHNMQLIVDVVRRILTA